jgi:hypothetical protein
MPVAALGLLPAVMSTAGHEHLPAASALMSLSQKEKDVLATSETELETWLNVSLAITD